MASVSEQSLGFRVSIAMLVPLLGVRRRRCCVAWEADSYISRKDQSPLLLLWFSGYYRDGVAVVVGVDEVDVEPLSDRAVGFGTAAL